MYAAMPLLYDVSAQLRAALATRRFAAMGLTELVLAAYIVQLPTWSAKLGPY
jgi:hypothetical protein